MAGHSQFALLRQRRFLPYFLTQALGAFNDNVFKNALVILVLYHTVGLTEDQSNFYANFAPGIFILPFFLFSATAGQIAEKFEKSLLIRWIKVLEILIMLAAVFGFLKHHVPVLMACLFMMGVHSTLFGPIKYSILPQTLREDELLGGNGLVEMGTSLSILFGIMLGGILVAIEPNGPLWASIAVVAIAVLGLITAFFIPRAAPSAPQLRINWNLFSETARNLGFMRDKRVVLLSCMGISWFWFYGSVFIAQLPNYSRIILGGNEHVVTFLLALFSIGVGVGSLLCERLSGRKIEIGLVPFGSIGMTLFGLDLYFAHPHATGAADLGIRAMLAQPGSWRMAFDLVMIGVFAGFYIVPLFALVQQRSEPEQRSRIIAGNNILNALFMVVAAGMAMGLLKAGLNIPQLFLVTAILNAVVAIYIYSLVPEFLVRFMTWILINTLYRLRVEGLEKIPEQGPVLIVCNHVSFMDPLIVGGSVRRPIRFVMYYKIFKWFGLNWFFRTARAIPIAGAKEDPEMMERAFAEVDRELAAGEVVAIFPEGGITRDGTVQPFRRGVERILQARPVPVVPVALRGMWGSLFSRRDRLRLPRRFWSRIGLVVGEPIAPEQASAEYLEQRVKELRGDWA
jgi:1-acyl-sn-glycerol-3-phosphate acyltransferase